MNSNKRLIFAAIIAALIAGVFWSQSRIPALNEKAQMGLRTSFGELAFEIVLPLTAQQSAFERIIRSSVNWAYTNLQGMTFGLLFAAAVLTIIANLRRRQFQSPWLNAISGVFVGAPLGVCVNCATPIAFGIYTAGARLETAMASLVASPTLNAIVLTMAFTLLPWEMALAKTAGVVLIIFCIPFFVRRFAGAPDIAAANRLASKNVSRLPLLAATETPPPDESIAAAAVATIDQFAKHLWYLVKFALPLMLLAGILGAVVIELVPFDTFTNAGAGIGALLAAGLVATFLPVPIAFDVVIVMALLSSGVDAGLAATLLFALGIYSIYPAAMIARYISPSLSAAFAVGVVIVAVSLGLLTQSWIGERTERNAREITAGLAESGTSLAIQAVEICSALPDSLQVSCYSRHIEDIADLVPSSTLCDYRPDAVSAAQCNTIVDNQVQTAAAIESLDAGACAGIADAGGRSQCSYAVILRTAQRDYDVGRCDVLPDRATVERCRADYLNASLLFNPDDSACRGLAGAALSECRVNAEIYRHADTLNIAACETLQPAAARDHCRYTIASTMIGRHDDASGCATIENEQMAARCESLPRAWAAARELNFSACEDLSAVGLRDTCLMRVADRRIEAVLARTLTVLIEPADALDDLVVPAIEAADPPVLESTRLSSSGGVEIDFAPFLERTPGNGAFRRIPARDLGIQSTWNFMITDFFEPFIIGKGLASGDFNNDLWPDLVFATESGVRVYKNTGGAFSLVPVAQGEIGQANLFVVALVDVDGDGWQDIFASAYDGTNYVIRNAGGGFEQATVERLPGDHRLTLSAAFGDLDHNGEVDIVLGNWSSGLEKLFAPVQSGNVIMMRRGGAYTANVMSEIAGETNSVLISDINTDGHPDVLIGNDRLVPDLYYTGDGTGNLTPLPTDTVPVTSMFTMSLESADFDNDLNLDLFSTDMTFARSSRDDYCAAIDENVGRQRCNELLEVYEGVQRDSTDRCRNLDDMADRQACFAVLSVRAAKTLQDASFCAGLPSRPAALRSLCDYLASPAETGHPIDQDAYVPQTQRNTLLLGGGDAFRERGETMGASSSFWSWNAKAADLDNDGWQDIYVGNGFHFGENFFEIQENVMFRNAGGEHFEEVQVEWGLNDPVNTPSYTYADLDFDGDLDIVATGVIAEPRVYLNELPSGESIAVSLMDERGNRFALGAVVTITYGSTSMQQRKELKLGGGFLSFDNPTLYFGTGDINTIDEIEVRWPDGEQTIIAGPLETAGIYRLVRRVLP